MRGIIPKKSLGQNFLKDQRYLDRIASYCVPKSGSLLEIHPETGGSSIAEIGPGMGHLTRAVLSKTDLPLRAVEIDERSREYLEEIKKSHANFDYVIMDASKYLYDDVEVVFGNLPYNIGTKILLNCCKQKVAKMVFLLQAEVVERVCAKTDESEYGSLSVLMQAYYEVKSVLTIPPNAFYPKPKVYSKLLVCELKDAEVDYEKLSKLLREAFKHPRKTIQNNLGKEFGLLFQPGFTSSQQERSGGASLDEVQPFFEISAKQSEGQQRSPIASELTLLQRSFVEKVQLDPKRRPGSISVGEYVALAELIMR